MVEGNFCCQLAQRPVGSVKRRALPISYKRMDICVSLLLIGYFALDLGTEIVCMRLVSIITIVFGGNDHCQHLTL
jgi:hypothetical protein